MEDELIQKIRRIYAAIELSEETDIEQLIAKPIIDGKRVGFHQNWQGNLSDEQMTNIAFSIIDNIANLKDHLKKWTTNHGINNKIVDACFENSEPLKIIQDLSNNDKHGYPPRKKGHSKMAPLLRNIHRVMQLKPAPIKGSVVSMTFDKNGCPIVYGSGTKKVILTGEIVDSDNKIIGDFNKIASQAISDWEVFLAEIGIKY
ncbi:MAG: hypothetical protein LLF82_001088 [Dehalococcoides mccartyi]|uniref:hypothetical protein n=1 Tax=Dehalococcoides mccartyi TaxID=61435 RepID=UPI00242A4DF3|nr:hypothetical protein [Dehalococcoides mccartyi]MCF7635603.1 hypothetical protein [Dehalococcoides mccartyi]MEA2120869.1 hypothetical protein [Dehalococcoides mccartyi]MEA2122538.1 hypothetical protein [Dehalococcoides mccartyi]